MNFLLVNQNGTFSMSGGGDGGRGKKSQKIFFFFDQKAENQIECDAIMC